MPRSRSPALLLVITLVASLGAAACSRQPAAPGVSSGPEQVLRVTRLQLVDLAKGIEAAHAQGLASDRAYQRLRTSWQDVALRHQQLIDLWRAKGAVDDASEDALARAILTLAADLAVSRGPVRAGAEIGGE